MDFKSLADLAKQIGMDAVILESHKNWVDKSPVKSLEDSAKWLNDMF